jgi:hypothetical protein
MGSSLDYGLWFPVGVDSWQGVQMTHFPRETRGCYYGRPDPCWLCLLRQAWAVMKARWG